MTGWNKQQLIDETVGVCRAGGDLGNLVTVLRSVEIGDVVPVGFPLDVIILLAERVKQLEDRHNPELVL